MSCLCVSVCVCIWICIPCCLEVENSSLLARQIILIPVNKTFSQSAMSGFTAAKETDGNNDPRYRFIRFNLLYRIKEKLGSLKCNFNRNHIYLVWIYRTQGVFQLCSRCYLAQLLCCCAEHTEPRLTAACL